MLQKFLKLKSYFTRLLVHSIDRTTKVLLKNCTLKDILKLKVKLKSHFGHFLGNSILIDNLNNLLKKSTLNVHKRYF